MSQKKPIGNKASVVIVPGPFEIPLTPSYRFMLLVKEWNAFTDKVATRENVERMRQIVDAANALIRDYKDDINGLTYHAANYSATLQLVPGFENLLFPIPHLTINIKTGLQ